MEYLVILLFLIASILSGEALSLEIKDASHKMPWQLRIVGGNEAIPNQFPYHVGLVLVKEHHFGSCGGALIASRWVLTATHCLDEAYMAFVCLGSLGHPMLRECQEQYYVWKSNFHIHERFESKAMSNDIALINLPQDVELGDGIQIIEIPSSVDIGRGFAGVMATATGWGKYTDDEDFASNVLQYVEVQVMNNSACFTFNSDIQRDLICTRGFGGKGPCFKDDGGPLVFTENGRRKLIGIVQSFSENGCEAGDPAIFTRVTAYLDWIKKIIEE